MDEDVSDLLVSMSEKNPYYNLLGMKVKEARNGSSRIEVEVKDDLLQLFGSVHGGVFASMVDAAAGLAVHSLLYKEGKIAVTEEFKVNLYRSVRSGRMIGEGEVEHMGSKIASCDVKIRNQDGKLVAKGLVTYYILDEDRSRQLRQEAEETVKGKN